MKVFLAGATGALGRPLVKRLVAAGHSVDALTRTPAKAAWLEAAGAQPVVADAMDRVELVRLVEKSRPDAVLDELTDLPSRLGSRPFAHFYDRMTPLKATASPALLEAAISVGARMHLMQSIAFAYAPGGAARKSEDDEPYSDPPPPWDQVMPPFASAEAAVLLCKDLVGAVMRYGFFYGPGTHYANDGAITAMVRRRRYPVIGSGEGLHSFIHVEDAAAATVAALEGGAAGPFNVVDDEPVAEREWVRHVARLVGAAPPRHVPRWLARIAAGPLAVHFATTLRGASNDRAKARLGWSPSRPNWYDGIREELRQR